MPISSAELIGIASRLAANRKKPTANESPRDEAVANLAATAMDACPLGEEIKGLHEPFKTWCHLHRILFCYSRSDKPTSNKTGQFDFVLMRSRTGAAIEFKALANPESGLSQGQKDWREWAERCGVPCLVTNSFKEATEFAILELKIADGKP